MDLQQNKLFETAGTTAAQEAVLIKLWNRKDDCIWKVLKHFYDYYMATGLSLVELGNYFADPKRYVGQRSLERVIPRLLEFKLITLIAKNVGPNKSRKYYAITEEGSRLWEAYIQQK